MIIVKINGMNTPLFFFFYNVLIFNEKNEMSTSAFLENVVNLARCRIDIHYEVHLII
jgi:hypothetical protein